MKGLTYKEQLAAFRQAGMTGKKTLEKEKNK
jgi:hypothetical protein